MVVDSKQASAKRAVLYRMVMEKHVCPYGLKSRWLLRREGYTVEDHALTTREETDAFMAQHGVDTTPQTFIGGQRIGGYTDLREYFDYDDPDADDTSYQPVLAIFGMCALLALGVTFGLAGTVLTWTTLKLFFAFSMAVLAIQKLQDVESFSTMFTGYDLLARRWVPYSYAYPFLEGLAAVLMVAGILPWLSGPIALAIGTVGAASVIYAVYVQKRSIKCACVGGGSNVPLGAVSLTENLVMMGMGIWTLAAWLA